MTTGHGTTLGAALIDAITTEAGTTNAPWPARIEQRQVQVFGQVRTGNDCRDRGAGRTSPFRIDGSEGDWSRIREAWQAGHIDPDDAEDWFMEDVLDEDPALCSTSDPWEFPGDVYRVDLV